MSEIAKYVAVGGLGALGGGIVGYLLAPRVTARPAADLEAVRKRVKVFVAGKQAVAMPIYAGIDTEFGVEHATYLLLIDGDPEAVMDINRWSETYGIEIARLTWREIVILIDNVEVGRLPAISGEYPFTEIGYFNTVIPR